jgi:signal recognition particle GTPase
MRLPIYYVGLGEKPDDLQPFSIDHYLDSILPEEKIVNPA